MTSHVRRLARRRLAALLAAATACGGDSTARARRTNQPSSQPAEELRLGFFANVTHATPLVGLTEGI